MFSVFIVLLLWYFIVRLTLTDSTILNYLKQVNLGMVQLSYYKSKFDFFPGVYEKICHKIIVKIALS